VRDDFLNQVEPSRARSSSSDPAYNSQANFEVVLSPAIVDEVLRALGYRKVRRLLLGTDARLWFEGRAGRCRRGQAAVGVCEDLDNDKYLAAAFKGRASHVVAGDRRFLALG